MRFLLYACRGLIDANISSLAALLARLRLEVAGRPAGVSDLWVLVFDPDDGRYLGRLNVLVEDGRPLLVRPGCRPLRAGSEAGVNMRLADARLLPA
jgi:hypothetical protein